MTYCKRVIKVKFSLTLFGEKPRKMKQRCFHASLAEKGGFEIPQEAAGLPTRKERLIPGGCGAAPAAEPAREICAMGSDGGDRDPRPTLRGGAQALGRQKRLLL